MQNIVSLTLDDKCILYLQTFFFVKYCYLYIKSTQRKGKVMRNFASQRKPNEKSPFVAPGCLGRCWGRGAGRQRPPGGRRRVGGTTSSPYCINGTNTRSLILTSVILLFAYFMIRYV